MGRAAPGRRRQIWQAGGLWSAAAAIVVVGLCAVAGVLPRLENQLYDSALRGNASAPLPEITIVGMDDASLAALGAWPWSWSRDAYAELIDQLSLAGAKTIVFTPLLSDPQPERSLAYLRRMRAAVARAGEASALAVELDRTAAEAENALDSDAHLAASIQRAGNVFLASRYTLAGGTPAPLPPYAHRSALPDTGTFALPATSGVHPLERFGAVAAGVGHLLAVPDEEDARVRRLPLLVRYDNVSVPSLALLAVRHSLHLSHSAIGVEPQSSGLRVGGLHIATDATATMRLRFAADRNGASPFPVVSFAQAASGKVPAQNFKDKIVLVGPTTDVLAAPWLQPGSQATMYPVEALAHAISAIRQGSAVQTPPWGPAAGWGSGLIALLIVAFVLPALPRRTGWMLAGGAAAVLVGVEWGTLRFASQWVPLLPAVLVLPAGAIALGLLRAPGGDAAAGASSETAETDRMMGLALHGQGQLDLAFERLRRVPPSDALMENLYHLARDFERKRNFAKAKSVYKHILQHDRAYKDAHARYRKVRALLQKDGETPSSHPPVASSLPPHSLPHLPGDASPAIPMLGRYQIDKEIGKGAMGVVYLGKDPKIGRVVAIKTLALGDEFEGEALIDARERFFREAETAGRLQHPCIVTIFDAGEEHDLAYIAMEFLKGTDLGHACQAQQLLPVQTVLSIGARVAEALDYAHAHNVVHRDIKPANIMFDSATDAVKVTDFGIARITDASKTRTGLVLGTPSFMSPEQLAGKKVDGRSDLYSLGATLFQLLTGSLPLRGESMTELMHKIATVPAPDVRQLRPDLSAEVARILALALQKSPQARYQTGRQFAQDLRSAAAAAAAPGAAPQPEAVVYDADRDATGREMADFQNTVMEPTAGQGTASQPNSGAR